MAKNTPMRSMERLTTILVYSTCLASAYSWLMEAVPDQMIDLDDVADFVACLLT